MRKLKIVGASFAAIVGFVAFLGPRLSGAAEREPANQVKLDGHAFTLPVGFTIERVAGPPLVNRPIVADMDERGRLYVADSSGSNEKVDVQVQKKPHRIVRLEDSDGDGRYDRAKVFADGVMFTEGAMWFRGSLYIAAPPQIWKLTDTNDDGVADRREIWFDGKTLTGCANDLHGPYRGPDGWIYWCKGAFAKQTYTLPNGKTFTTRASHIFRARPDGTSIEPVMTGGMDNPVDVVFTPGGERIFTTTFLQHPAAGHRDGLIHAIYGGIYGKDHDPIHDADHKWTSPKLMPELTHMGPAAPCGLHRYESDQFGPDYQNNLFACQFNLRKVSRHVLQPAGSTFTTQDSDFVVSDNHDFHPTDVIEDADGSLLVVNTGGWYKLCCPSSQLVKADVLGAIYRVKKTGMHRVEDPYGQKIQWTRPPPSLVQLLGDRRPVVRRRAIERLAEGGEAAVAALPAPLTDGKSSPEAAQGAVWTLCRIDSPSARELTRRALRHDDETVRHVALQTIGLWRDRDAVVHVMEMLRSSSRHNRRAAAEALGRIGRAMAIPALFETLSPLDDPCSEHAILYALMEIGIARHPRIGQWLESPDPRVRRAAMVALDQTGAPIDVKTVLASLNHPDAGLRDSARWIAGRHPEWGDELASYLRGQLRANLNPEEQTELAELLARFAKGGTVESLIADAVRSADKSPAAGRVALQAMARAGLKQAPSAWVSVLAQAAMPSSPVLSDVLATARALPVPKEKSNDLTAALLKLADSAASPEVRLDALAAVPGGLTAVSASQWNLLLEHVDRNQSARLRGVAAEVLSQARLTTPQLVQLAGHLAKVGPLEIDRLLSAFAQTGDETVGQKLLATLAAPEVRPMLRVDSIQQRLTKYGPTIQREAAKLYALLNGEYAQQQTRLDELAKSLPAGDIRRGQAVYNSNKTSCLACHTIGYVGGKIGPDLTRIGQIRSDRDLLESVLFPSASFVRSYESLAVLTTDGRTFNGIVKKDAADEIILIEAADKEVRIPRSLVEATQPGKVSIMPAGLDKQLSSQELADLITFLRACR